MVGAVALERAVAAAKRVDSCAKRRNCEGPSRMATEAQGDCLEGWVLSGCRVR